MGYMIYISVVAVGMYNLPNILRLAQNETSRQRF